MMACPPSLGPDSDRHLRELLDSLPFSFLFIISSLSATTDFCLMRAVLPLPLFSLFQIEGTGSHVCPSFLGPSSRKRVFPPPSYAEDFFFLFSGSCHFLVGGRRPPLLFFPLARPMEGSRSPCKEHGMVSFPSFFLFRN